MFDLPLEQCRTYRGSNPRPADFDEFWHAGLAEMRATAPDVDLVPAEYCASVAECFHLHFTGVGGARVHAKLLRRTRSFRRCQVSTT